VSVGASSMPNERVGIVSDAGAWLSIATLSASNRTYLP
jgi:hypothetical protein